MQKEKLLQLDTIWLKQFPILRLERNNIIISQGIYTEYCYYLTSGIVARFNLDAEGREFVVQYHFAYELLGFWDDFIFEDKTSPAFVRTKTQCYAYKIPKESLLSYMYSSPEYYQEFLTMLMKTNQYIFWMYKHRSTGSYPQVICYTLFHLMQEMPNGVYYLDKTFSITELSLHLHMHRMTISRTIAALVRENVLCHASCGLEVLAPQRLLDYADGRVILNL